MRFLLIMMLFLNILNAENRMALVIGNSKYEHMEKLTSPKDDTKAMVKKLKSLGFTVMEAYDLSESKMMATIKKFEDTLTKGSVGFFYYSGHGGQVEKESFLIPTSVNTRDENSIRYHAVKVEEVLRRMESAETMLNILILDACRDDTPTGKKGTGDKGLGNVIYKPVGSLILYSTGMGETAKDSNLFNKVVLQKLGTPKRNILNVVNDISNEVAKRTNNKQIPEVISRVVPDIVLSSGSIEQKIKNIEATRLEIIELSKAIEKKKIIEEGTSSLPKSDKGKLNKGTLLINGKKWQDRLINQNKAFSWQSAINYCKNLQLNGYGDWKLPSHSELKKFYKYRNKAKYKINNYYWSSTTHKEDSNYAWMIDYTNGKSGSYYKNRFAYVRCVR